MPYLPNQYSSFNPTNSYSQGFSGLGQNISGAMNFVQRGQDFNALDKVNPQEAFDNASNVGNGLGDTLEGMAGAGIGGKGFKRAMGIYSLAKGGALSSL